MSLRKIQRGRLELTGIILLPIVLLVLIHAVEYVHCRRVEREIALRRLHLRLVPMMEKRFDGARERMKLFMDAEDGADGSSELTMRVSRGAQEAGFSTRAVKLEKLPATEGGSWTDYKVVASGEGTLQALARFLDDCERIGPRPFRVTQARIAARSLSPETVYDAEFELMLRALHCDKPAAKPLMPIFGARVDEAAVLKSATRVDGLLDAIQKRQRSQPGLLPLAKLTGRQSAYGPVEETEAPFRLTGVIRDAKKPLALTDQGLMGIGEERDGFRVVEIREDAVVVEKPQGGRIVMKLYQEGER